MSRTSKIWSATNDAVLGKPELTSSDVNAATGVSMEQAGRLWQALGFPKVRADEQAFGTRDVATLRFAASLFEEQQLDVETLTQMARATGQALARVAHMHALSIASEVEAVTRSTEFNDNEAADRVAALAESVVRDHEPFLTYIWRRHLASAISQTVAAASANESNSDQVVVGFADLVDFTTLSRQLSELELCRVVTRFEAIAYEQVPDRGGRIVKTIGDEVMFAHVDPASAAETALALSEACARDETVPEVRVGLAVGPALAWEGDLFGNTVNLASRLVGVARPSTVIVSGDLAASLEGNATFEVQELRKTRLKGIGKMRPWVLRAAAA